MIIKVIKATADQFWYSKFVGRLFHVELNEDGIYCVQGSEEHTFMTRDVEVQSEDINDKVENPKI